MAFKIIIGFMMDFDPMMILKAMSHLEIRG
jgi:hypothetical protein